PAKLDENSARSTSRKNQDACDFWRPLAAVRCAAASRRGRTDIASPDLCVPGPGRLLAERAQSLVWGTQGPRDHRLHRPKTVEKALLLGFFDDGQPKCPEASVEGDVQVGVGRGESLIARLDLELRIGAGTVAPG